MLGWGLLIALSAWAGVWLLGDRLRSVGWRNIDGFVDCYPACDAWDGLGAWFFFGPPIVIVVSVVAAAVVAAIDRHRSQARSGRRS
jgi:hypothetical protein